MRNFWIFSHETSVDVSFVFQRSAEPSHDFSAVPYCRYLDRTFGFMDRKALTIRVNNYRSECG
jgi:hypothetical protein